MKIAISGAKLDYIRCSQRLGECLGHPHIPISKVGVFYLWLFHRELHHDLYLVSMYVGMLMVRCRIFIYFDIYYACFRNAPLSARFDRDSSNFSELCGGESGRIALKCWPPHETSFRLRNSFLILSCLCGWILDQAFLLIGMYLALQ